MSRKTSFSITWRTASSYHHKAFDAKHNRFMMTQKDRLEGRSSPEHTASQAALNLWEIETVYRRMYMPHEDEFFTYNGQRFVNFYSEVGVPDMPDELSGDEKLAIKRVQAHMRHLFRYERDWKLLLDWLAYVVQTRKRVSWMPIIQGTEGDGKTFFAEMLKRSSDGRTCISLPAKLSKSATITTWKAPCSSSSRKCGCTATTAMKRSTA
jgi:hypothetical protein